MWYVISRTSQHGDIETPPHPRAVFREHGVAYRRDERTTDDPAKIPSAKGQSAWWYAEGVNHRIENGNIVRDMPVTRTKVWMIEVNSLDELNDIASERDVVLTRTYLGLMEIEIYDDNRE